MKFQKKGIILGIFLILAVISTVIFLKIDNKAHAVPTTYYVDGTAGNDAWDGTSATHTSGLIGPKQTIGAGVTVTPSNGTLIIAAGIYVNIGEITFPNPITVRSTANTYDVDPASQTIIDSTGKFTFVAGSTGSTVRGFYFRNNDTRSINLDDPGDDITIEYNQFISTADAYFGIYSDVVGDDNLVIRYNNFEDIVGNGSEAIYIYGNINPVITDNDFWNINFIGIGLFNVLNADVEDNEIDTINVIGQSAISVGFDSTGTITGNYIYDGPIYLHADELFTGPVNITNNVIRNATGPSAAAILTDGTDFGPPTVTVTYNDFMGSVTGINHSGIGTITATNNWWGNASGPSHTSNHFIALGGLGNQAVVTDNVVYYPWLSSIHGTAGSIEGTSFGPVSILGLSTKYLDPADAIAAASPGSTIILSRGTFFDLGAVVIDKSLTVISEAGTWNTPQYTKITGTSIFVIDNAITNSTIKGFIFEDTDDSAIVIAGSGTGNVIEYNKFANRNIDADHVAVWAITGDGLTIRNNYFKDITGPTAAGIFLGSRSNVQILNNTFDNIGLGAIMAVLSTGFLIQSNTISNISSVGAGAINLAADSTGTIEGNRIYANNLDLGAGAIYLAADSLTTGTINIQDNIINNSSGSGIGNAISTDVSTLGAVTLNINNNDLSLNTNGLYVDDVGIATVHAANNWWGSSTGPYNALDNPWGKGSGYSSNTSIYPYKLFASWSNSGPTASNISMSVFLDRLYEAKRKSDNKTYTRFSLNGDTWGSWVYSGLGKGNISMAVLGTKLFQAKRGADDKIYTRYTTNGSSWTSWVKHTSSVPTLSDVALAEFGSKLYLAVRTTSNKLYIQHSSTSGTTWSAWTNLGTTIDTPTLQEFQNKLYIGFRTASNKGYIRYSSTAGTTWSGAIYLGSAVGKVSLASFQDVLYAAMRGSNSGIYTRTSPDGTTWAAAVKSGNTLSNITMVASGFYFYQAVRGGTGKVYIRFSIGSNIWTSWVNIAGASLGDPNIIDYKGELFQSIKYGNGTGYTTNMSTFST